MTRYWSPRREARGPINSLQSEWRFSSDVPTISPLCAPMMGPTVRANLRCAAARNLELATLTLLTSLGRSDCVTIKHGVCNNDFNRQRGVANVGASERTDLANLMSTDCSLLAGCALFDPYST